MHNYDSIIIGFGKAGKTLANFLAKKGQKVALIEKDPNMFGGTCINVGCIPTKYLINRPYLGKASDDFSKKQEHYLSVIESKNLFLSKLRNNNYKKVVGNSVEVIVGEAHFVSDKVLEVNKEQYEARDIFINTGSKSFIPAIEGLKDNKYVYTSDSLLNLTKLPKELVIIGGGNIGLEFAFMYSNFGSKVTILSNEQQFMGREDLDVSSEIKDAATDNGINIVLNVKIKQIENNIVKYAIEDKQFSISGDVVLVATGRVANTADLALENTSIKTNERGAIIVDKNLKTSVDNIFALGDVNGELQFTYISLDDFRIIKSNIEGKGYNLTERKNVPYSIFIKPALSRVGITEKEAKERKLNYKVYKVFMRSHPKAHIVNNTHGFIKILVDSNNDLILGASVLSDSSYELIGYIKMALDNNIPFSYIKENIYTHPTIIESLNDLEQEDQL